MLAVLKSQPTAGKPCQGEEILRLLALRYVVLKSQLPVAQTLPGGAILMTAKSKSHIIGQDCSLFSDSLNSVYVGGECTKSPMNVN